MKTLYLAITVVAIIGLLSFDKANGEFGMSDSALFMKTNSTGTIYANFTFPVSNNKTWSLEPGIYLPLTASPVLADHNNMTITAEPSSFNAGKDNVTVTYEITAKNSTRGVYALFLYYCGETPLIVGLNESQVNPETYKQFFSAVYSCPAMLDYTPKMSYAGFSNIVLKRIDIGPNGTVKEQTLSGNFTKTSEPANPTSPIPYSIRRSAVPTLTPSENQSLVNIALAIPGLQQWSNDWHYVDTGFLGNDKLATGGFEWKYALLDLKAPSGSAPLPCANGWWAWVDIDMTTMKVVRATYPTMESHPCVFATGGGPVTTLGATTSKTTQPASSTGTGSPLDQFRSGIAARNVKCENGLDLVIKSEDGSPACVRPDTAKVLVQRGWAGNAQGISALGIPTIELDNVTSSMRPIILGMSFFVTADVTNNQNVPITYYGGCASPLTVSFDNIQTQAGGPNCLAVSRYVLGPHEQALVQSDKINTVYNSTSPGYADAKIRFTYENNGTKYYWFTAAQFPVQRAIKLNCTETFGEQVARINSSVNATKAIALAYSSPEFQSKARQYGDVTYEGIHNDLFPSQSCDSYWKDVEVMFTANTENGTRNIRVTEDIGLTKVLKVEDFVVVPT